MAELSSGAEDHTLALTRLGAAMDRTATALHPVDGVGAEVLDADLTAIETVQQAVNALEGARAVLVERFRRHSEAHEDSLVDAGDPQVRVADRRRRAELARRAAVADLATSLHQGEDATHRLVQHAETLTQQAPRVLATLMEERTSWRSASAVAREADDLTPHEARHVESSVLPVLTTGTPAQITSRARRAREVAHPVPADVRHTEALEKRDVWLDPGRDGTAWLTAHLSAPFAHAIYDRLTSTAGQMRRSGDSRTTGQLRSDTLADLLLDDGSLDRSLPASTALAAPTSGSEDGGGRLGDGPAEDPDPVPRAVGTLAPIARAIRARVNVTVPVLSLLGIVDAPARLDGRTPIDADTARTLAAHAPSLRRILTDPESGAVLSVGRSTYQVPADLKAVLTERDATCRFPGCLRPASRTDLDHTVAWARGGSTSAQNLAHLCRPHHVLKHQSRWSVRQVDDPGSPLGGGLEWTSPTGRVHHTAPDPPETTRHRHLPEPGDPDDHSAVHDYTVEGDPPPF